MSQLPGKPSRLSPHAKMRTIRSAAIIRVISVGQSNSTGAQVRLRIDGLDLALMSVPYEKDIQIEWASSNATSCRLFKNDVSTEWTGTDNYFVEPNLIAEATYQVRCLEGNSNTIRVLVLPQPAVFLTLNGVADDLDLTVGSQITVAWKATGFDAARGDRCRVYEDVTTLSDRVEAVSLSTVRISKNSVMQYLLECTQPSGKQYRKLFTVSPKNATSTAPVILTNSATGTSAYGSQITFSWTSSGATRCDLVYGENVIRSATTATNFLSPALTAGLHRFTLTCYNSANQASTPKYYEFTIDEPINHAIFVSHQTTNGNLGGLDGADQKCKAYATAAGLRADRPWRALLSSSSAHARDRIRLTGDVKLKNGTLVASAPNFWKDISNLWLHPVNMTENGVAISSLYRDVWTGTNANGTNGAPFCDNWFSGNSGRGQVGDSHSVNNDRVRNGDRPCDEFKRIYCISQ